MKAQIQRRGNPFKSKYSAEDYDVARQFATKLYKEFGALIKAIMIFGGESSATSQVAPALQDVMDPQQKHKAFLQEIKQSVHPALDSARSATSIAAQSQLQSAQQFVQDVQSLTKGDIDVLVIVDNVSFYLTPEIIEVYRVVTEKIAFETSKRLHITTLRITSFWEYMRVGDPVGINILRSGIALIDTGFIYPMQLLLFEGRIRPTPESVSSYFSRASTSLLSSQSHLIQATLDLYWAAIDASHAAIMQLGEIPASPKEVPSVLHEKFVKTGKMNKKYPATMEKIYSVSRKILHREIREISGKDYQDMQQEVKEFVDVMKKISGRK